MKVSILIPVYNAEDFIAACIQSALDQSYKNIEIIVLDDGSTDNSLNVAKEFENKGVKVFTVLNGGSQKCRNLLLEIATGDIIQYLDADDILHPDKIKFQIEILKENLNCIISCAWGKFTNDISETKFIKQSVWQTMLPEDWLVEAWNGGGMMQTACWLTPKHLIEMSGKWDESLEKNPADDGEFYARVMLKANKVIYVDQSKVYYRDDLPNSVSKNKSDKAIKSILGNCFSYKKAILEVKDSLEIRNAICRNFLSFIYEYHYSHPELSKIAFNEIKSLGIGKWPLVGGKKFQAISKFIGFKNALLFKKFL